MSSRVNKSCDQCRLRKVRCISPDSSPGAHTVCIPCARRGEICHFSVHKRRFLPKVSETSQTPLTPGASRDFSDLYIDCMLRDGPQNETLTDETGVIKTSDDRVPSSTLTFFSDPQLDQLSQKIGSDRLKTLIHKIDTIITERLRGRASTSWTRIHFTKPQQPVVIYKEVADGYIDAYFKFVHPVYPFLDRGEFTSRTLSHDDTSDAPEDKTFSALYYSVLALGSQYVDGGTFQPGQGVTWNLFQTALGYVADVIVPKETLENLQALTAMSVFATNACCLQLEDTLIGEAARMALSLRYHKSANSSVSELRTFWVIYYMEKQSCFQNRMSSIISDDDVACPIPPAPDSIFEEFNWFLSAIRFARLSSVAYSTLFTVSARRQSQDAYLKAIDHVYQRLEDWRLSIPNGFRPGESFHHLSMLAGSGVKLVAVQTQYLYFSMRVVLERLVMRVASHQDVRRENSKLYLMWAARTIIELTRHIDIEPHVPVFIMGVMPMSGLFILFDFVMHNPLHEETRDNIALLDAATGYFSHLEYISKGALPGSIISEFTQIARDFCYQAERSAKLSKLRNEDLVHDVSSAVSVDTNVSQSDQPEDATHTFSTHVLPENEYLQPPTMEMADDALVYPVLENCYFPEGGQLLEYGDMGDMRTFFGALLSDFGENQQ
ncbi:hypothetical protein E4U42_006899 [Claviceps africana]|uniref:Zn(2)-C6 fungal-type domain-containing protein n=1 Tax=Claviceps africana TaxID=83212 RepID=A0A8K0NIV2_9HYPO|nr:hypothetical protein E4U42_006899 [Claviceps africana]